jgi:methanogenic corrinoid protein MtbC1
MGENEVVANILNKQIDDIAREVVEKIYSEQSKLVKNYDEVKKGKSIRDVRYHLMFLSDAILVNSTLLFEKYIGWARDIMENIGISAPTFSHQLTIINNIIYEYLNKDHHPVVKKYFDVAIEELSKSKPKYASFITKSNKYHELAKEYLILILNSKRNEALKLIMKAAEDVPIKDIYLSVFQPVQREIGRLWQKNKISVAQEHYSTAVTQFIMANLYPYIFNGDNKENKFAGLSVSSELHEVGIRMVTDIFELEGWDTYYLGANTPTDSIIDMIISNDIDVVGVSATMSYHVSKVRDLIARIKQATENKTRVLVGGYPFLQDDQLSRTIGADGFATDATKAVKIAEELV